MIEEQNLMPLRHAAARLRVPAKWLAAEVVAKRIPALQAGSRLLVDIELARRLLTERARGEARLEEPGES
mgnify:CR=1 FL=1